MEKVTLLMMLLVRLMLHFISHSSVCFSHGAAEKAEATVQRDCGGQEAQAAESPERSEQSPL